MDKNKAALVPLANKFSEVQCTKNQLELDEIKGIPYEA